METQNWLNEPDVYPSNHFLSPLHPAPIRPLSILKQKTAVESSCQGHGGLEDPRGGSGSSFMAGEDRELNAVHWDWKFRLMMMVMVMIMMMAVIMTAQIEIDWHRHRGPGGLG